MTELGQTPSQTVGPFFSMRLSPEGENLLAPADVPGRVPDIEGALQAPHISLIVKGRGIDVLFQGDDETVFFDF